MFWIPPPYDLVKINFDASYFEGRAGLGYMIRNHYGTVLYAAFMSPCSSSGPEAKLEGAWYAMNTLVYNVGCTRIWLEGDSMIIINWIITHQKQHSIIMSSTSLTTFAV